MSVLTTQPAPPASPVFEDEQPSGSGNRRTLLLVGGIVAALAAAAAAYFFLFSGGGSTPAPTAVQPPAAAPKASASPSASAPAGTSSGTKRSSYPLTSRDPFSPLPVAGAKASTTTTSSSSSTTQGAPKPAAPIATPITFILASVDAKAGTATLSVDGTSYDATVGKVFGKDYMLYAVFNTTCAGVLVGDQSVPICVGHSVSVTP